MCLFDRAEQPCQPGSGDGAEHDLGRPAQQQFPSVRGNPGGGSGHHLDSGADDPPHIVQVHDHGEVALAVDDVAEHAGQPDGGGLIDVTVEGDDDGATVAADDDRAAGGRGRSDSGAAPDIGGCGDIESPVSAHEPEPLSGGSCQSTANWPASSGAMGRSRPDPGGGGPSRTSAKDTGGPSRSSGTSPVADNVAASPEMNIRIRESGVSDVATNPFSHCGCCLAGG